MSEARVIFVIEPARLEDSDRIESVHVDSIRTLGAKAYGPEVIGEWSRLCAGARYRAAMARGERFFLAIEEGSEGKVLGFSSYRTEGGKHRTAVYVAGHVARQGVGSALYRKAEAVAKQNGADEIHVAASLGAVDFYRSNGFLETSRGQHRLSSAATMGCVFMRKLLRTLT
jgi:putative acetyltransferase